MTTIKDVAKLSGFSPSAVSKYLINPDSVRDATRRSIESAINELGYTPSPVARSLRTGKTGIVAVLVPEITNPVFAELFSYIYEGCMGIGMTPVLHTIGGPDQLERVTAAVSPYHADGLIFCFLNEDVIEPLTQCAGGSAIINIGFNTDKRVSGSIVVDVAEGMRQVAGYLLSKQYRDIAYLGEPGGDTASMKKIGGFLEGISGRSVVRILQGYRGLDMAHEATGLLLERGVPDAIVCETDILAIGCLKRLAQERITVPDTVSVIGFDDIQIAGMYEPPLTTVRLPLERISKLSVEMLDDTMKGRKQDPVEVTPELVLRRSTKGAE